MPLFNFSSSLSENAKSILFDSHLSQGVVGKKVVTFKDGNKRDKYFIVVNKEQSDPIILSVLLQSDPEYALKHPILKTHIIKVSPKECDYIFPKECYIDCTELIEIPREEVLSAFLLDPQILLGKLPEEVINKIRDVIIGSNIIEPEKQEKVY